MRKRVLNYSLAYNRAIKHALASITTTVPLHLCATAILWALSFGSPLTVVGVSGRTGLDHRVKGVSVRENMPPPTFAKKFQTFFSK